MSDIKLRTNADRIRSMTDEELANYLHRVHANGHSKNTMLEWLRAVYVSDRIKIVVPGKQYEGDFGRTTTWEDAYNKEIDWLRKNGYIVQEGIGEVGKG